MDKATRVLIGCILVFLFTAILLGLHNEKAVSHMLVSIFQEKSYHQPISGVLQNK